MSEEKTAYNFDDTYKHLPPDMPMPKSPLGVFTKIKDGDTVINSKGGKQSHIEARFDCIPPECLRLLAQCLGYGKNRYGRGNWKNIDIDDNLCHAMNHINEWNRGDRSEPHLVNAIARLNFALWQAVDSGEQPETYIHPDSAKIAN